MKLYTYDAKTDEKIIDEATKSIFKDIPCVDFFDDVEVLFADEEIEYEIGQGLKRHYRYIILNLNDLQLEITEMAKEAKRRILLMVIKEWVSKKLITLDDIKEISNEK